MFDRSLLGSPLLLLAASCVPPQAAGPTVAAGSQAVASAPNLSAFIDASGHPGGDGGPPMTLLADAIAPAQPFDSPAQAIEDASRSLDCLTAAVYYEARSEPVDGQRAVAQVVLNRVRNPAFPNSVCGVVYQGALRTTGCQFSFTCDGSMTYRRERDAWERARAVAQAALAGSVDPDVGTATFYHTTAILPWWASSLTRIATIGAHIFYKWPGQPGDPSAFRQLYSGIEPDAARAALDRSSDAALVQYAAGVSVHRGEAVADVAATPGGDRQLVQVHFGDAPQTAAEPQPSATQPSAAVVVHRGDAAAG